MTVDERHAGIVRLVDRRTRVVEVLGPEPMGARHASDRELLLDTYQSMMDRPQRIGFCFEADRRRAKFLIDEGSRGDQLLDLLASRPKTPARPVRPYAKGWLLDAT